MNILEATWTDPKAPSPESGEGILKAVIYVNTVLCGDIPLERHLAYEYIEREPKYLEVWVTNPNLEKKDRITYCGLDEDIRIAFQKELPSFKIQTINYL